MLFLHTRKLEVKKLQHPNELSRIELGAQEIQDKRLGYVDSVFPSVYQSKRWLSRLLSELGIATLCC